MFDPETELTTKTFMPYAYLKYMEGIKNNLRFVHYSNADAAKNILYTKEVWFRKTSCMNDFMEVKHGVRCLINSYGGPSGERLKAVIEEIHPGVMDQVEELYNGWVPHFYEGTYVVCLSEHDPREDETGRLSMWRAYGRDAGVALVFKNTPFFRIDNTLNVFSSPVAYLNDEDFSNQLDSICGAVNENKEFIEKLNGEAIVGNLFNSFYFASLCTKHPGFREEAEWRIVYSPALHHSQHLYKTVETVQGHPQIVYKLPLQNRDGAYGIELREILERIIIGPCENAYAVSEALAHLLEGAGIEEPESMIRVSDIPLR